jgi:hypothetical protein
MNKYQVLQNNLMPDENLLWSEAPSPLASFRGSSIFGFIFGIIWTCLVASSFSASGRNGKPPLLFDIAFVGVGVVFTSLSLRDAAAAIFSVYGLTNQRLIIATRYPWKSVVQSFWGRDIEFLKKERRDNGSGNLVIKTIKVKAGRSYTDKDLGFFGIKNVDSVESLIIQNFRPHTLN